MSFLYVRVFAIVCTIPLRSCLNLHHCIFMSIGLIETNDFVEFLYFRTQTIKQRIWQLQHRPKCAVIPFGSSALVSQARTGRSTYIN